MKEQNHVDGSHSFDFFFALIVVLLATSVDGFQKNWLWSNNWDNPDNWNLRRLPCSRDRIFVGNVRFSEI